MMRKLHGTKSLMFDGINMNSKIELRLVPEMKKFTTNKIAPIALKEESRRWTDQQDRQQGGELEIATITAKA